MALWHQFGLSGPAVLVGGGVAVGLGAAGYVFYDRSQFVLTEPAAQVAPLTVPVTEPVVALVQPQQSSPPAEPVLPAPSSQPDVVEVTPAPVIEKAEMDEQEALEVAVADPLPEPTPGPALDPLDPSTMPIVIEDGADMDEAGSIAVEDPLETMPAQILEDEPELAESVVAAPVIQPATEVEAELLEAEPEPKEPVELAAIATPPDPGTPDSLPQAAAAPRLDLVRIESDTGAALLAGTAEPGARISITIDGQLLATLTADVRGKFASMFEIPEAEIARVLSINQTLPDGTLQAATAQVMIAPVKLPLLPQGTLEPPASKLAEVLNTPRDPDGPAITENTPALAQALESLDTPLAEVPPQSPSGASVPIATAPTLVLADADGVRVLQPQPQPVGPRPEVSENVVIDTIAYDSKGDVAVTGRGSAEGFVRVYLDDAPVLTAPIGETGTWKAPLDDITAGVYTLRVDELDAEGEVTSRVETPFQREEVEIAARAAPSAVTVQPGFTLWAIARDRFGKGIEYVRVYEANRDLIRDPDLIYPGQVFELPEN